MSFVSPRPSGFSVAKPRGTLRIVGKKNPHCFTLYRGSQKENKLCGHGKKNYVLDSAGPNFAAILSVEAQDLVRHKFKMFQFPK